MRSIRYPAAAAVTCLVAVLLATPVLPAARVVLFEQATNYGCGPCATAAPIIHGVLDKGISGHKTQEIKPYNRHIARKLLDTGVVKNALKIRGTPFLYKPSRMLGAMGTLNNQETTWTEALDAENLDPYRPHMEGCYRCPVNCRPANDQLYRGRHESARPHSVFRSHAALRARHLGGGLHLQLHRSTNPIDSPGGH